MYHRKMSNRQCNELKICVRNAYKIVSAILRNATRDRFLRKLVATLNRIILNPYSYPIFIITIA